MFNHIYEISGKVPSKSNCYKTRAITSKGKPIAMWYKSKELQEYEFNFSIQIQRHTFDFIQDQFELYADVYMVNKMQDIDNTLKILLDCLEQNNVIFNDNLCYKIVINKHIDKVNPRVVFYLNKYEEN